MARVIVVTPHPPLAEGGHLVIAHALVNALNEHGHEAGLVTTPQNRFDRIDDAALVKRLAGCRAVCFPPHQEDYGLVTAEAFASARPVITCTDSGGPAELAQHGVQGLVCEPNSSALAAAMRELMEDGRGRARRGGGDILAGDGRAPGCVVDGGVAPSADAANQGRS